MMNGQIGSLNNWGEDWDSFPVTNILGGLEAIDLFNVNSLEIVSRPKLKIRAGRHFGVLVKDAWGRECVYDLNQAAGIRKKSLSDFSAGYHIQYGEPLPGNLVEQAVARLKRFIDSGAAERYDLLGNNCEHFANYVVFDKRVSQQVNSAGFAFALLMLFKLCG